jgi:hypothetical protein
VGAIIGSVGATSSLRVGTLGMGGLGEDFFFLVWQGVLLSFTFFSRRTSGHIVVIYLNLF